MGMKVVVYFETLKGNTQTTGEHIATAFSRGDADVAVRSIDDVDLNQLAEADLVVFGTWVHGLRWVGVGPAGMAKIKNFPAIQGKRAAVFCTYRWNPKKSLDTMAAAVSARGANVIAAQSFQEHELDKGIREFVAGLLAASA